MGPTIVWLRQDLRTRDNPALAAAAARGPVLPLYILDDATPGKWRLGAASRWWLHMSLRALAKDIPGLVLRAGDPGEIISRLAADTNATAIYWNRCYEPHAVARDAALKKHLAARGLETTSFNASLLHEPWEIKTKDGGPFKVFTPYWRAAAARDVAAPLPAAKLKCIACRSDALDDWKLLPSKPNWAAGWEKLWTPGEKGAAARLRHFIEESLAKYAADRDRPDLPATSRLSPHLHFGEISPRQIWSALAFKEAATHKFASELGWREFSHHLLFHFPTLPQANWKSAFDAFPWRAAKKDFAAWSRGLTGYPMVDAGMRELWSTGFMHNRVRMIAASFLIKHLRIDWREGEAWFWDTLLDADLANNAASWQWVAGSGADASPFFRIFNPVTQGRKFDPDGKYVRRWIPEIAQLPDDFIHAPFDAPADALKSANIVLGKTYPKPIVDHAEARAAALAAYKTISG
ncbi:MAG: deoxyribodipyrimidine photo-lyase [Hyphomonadaceae bacterium]|nr:deoxyribodipyrimidine photo-lyase [Hyphomonadaceae bacterium]